LNRPVELASARGPAKRAGATPLAHDAEDAYDAVKQRLVLIADDYEDTRLLYAEHLEASGFRVVDAADGEQAVALALSLRPDAIVMDLSMPKLDGWDAIRRIRADEQMAGVYIIALSAMESEVSREMAFDAGCNDFIGKPFLAEALAQVLLMHFRDRTGDGAA
jgi:CheY-like chemotaxis protein